MDDFKTQYLSMLSSLTGLSEEALRSDDRYKEVFKKIDTSELLLLQAQKISDKTIPAINTDAPVRLVATARLIQNDLLKRVLSENVLPLLISGVSADDRTRALDTFKTKYPLFEEEINRLFPSTATVTEDGINSAITTIGGELLSFEQMKETVNNMWKSYVLDGEVEDASDQLYVTVSKFDTLLGAYDSDLQRSFEARLRRLYEMDQELALLSGEAAARKRDEMQQLSDSISSEFGHIPGYTELTQYYFFVFKTEESYEHGLPEPEPNREEAPTRTDNNTGANQEPPKIDQTQRNRFLINNQTGAIIDNRVIRREQQLANYIQATGDVSCIIDESAFESAFEYYCHLNLPDLSKESGRKKYQALEAQLRPTYGDDWYEIYKQQLKHNYAIKYKQTMENLKRGPITEGLAARQRNQDRRTPVSFEEVTFVATHFEKRANDAGEEVLYIKGTDKAVTSERTKATYDFAISWIKAFGRTVDSEGNEVIKSSVAFAKENEGLFNTVQTSINNNMNEAGEINTLNVLRDLTPTGKTNEVDELISRYSDAVKAFHNVQTQQPVRTATREEGRIV